jgi:hypothetical protein
MRANSTIALLAATPLLVAGSEPVRLPPSSPWVLDYAADSCKLSRQFGEGKNITVLQFESAAPGELSMIVVGKPVATTLEWVPAKFLPSQDKGMLGKAQIATDRQPAILWPQMLLVPVTFLQQQGKKAEAETPKPGVRPPPIDFNYRAAERAARKAFVEAAREVEIDVRPNKPIILETGSLGDPIKMFDQCSRDSLRDWGVDPDLEDKIVRRAWAPDPSKWFSAADYPRKMEKERMESLVKVRLLVDAAGNVTKCTSLSNFDAPVFNQAVCDIFKKRAKFEPAELADGTKVPSYFINQVVFRLPD